MNSFAEIEIRLETVLVFYGNLKEHLKADS